MIQSAALIGLGSMGSFFAPGLYRELGEDHFCVIADGDRKKRLEEKGVTINGTNYRFSCVAPEDGSPVDLIIIAVKELALNEAIAAIKKFVGEKTQILSILNGIDSEERVAAVYGWDHILYSFMRMSINMKDGVADYDPTKGNIHFGEKENSTLTGRVEAIRELFEKCGIAYRIDEDMLAGQWFKYSCNVGENLTCALLGVPFRAFQESESANFIRESAMKEVIAVANAKGINLSAEDCINRQRRTIPKLPPQNKPSTLIDLEAGKPTEVEMFAGRMVEMGREYGIPTPVCEVLLHGIRVLESKLLHNG